MRWVLLSVFVSVAWGAPVHRQCGLAVVNKNADSVTLFDQATHTPCGGAATGRSPHEVAAAAGRLVVTDYGSRSPSTLTVVPHLSSSGPFQIPLGAHEAPHGVEFLADAGGGRYVVVSTEGTATVIIVDVESGEVVRAFDTAPHGVHMVAVHPGGELVFGTALLTGTTVAINVTSGAVTAIATGAGSEGLDFSADGAELWVTNRDADTIAVVDTAALAVTATFSSGGSFPIRTKCTLDGTRFLVSNAYSGTVEVFDAATRARLASIALPGGGTPVGLLMHRNGALAYVAQTQSDQLALLDLATYTVVTHITDGLSEPDGMAEFN